jgi:Flp pilus assembly pilin Flp
MTKKNRTHKENGQGVIEYALIAAGVAVVTILILSMMGVSVQSVYCQAITGLGGSGCGCSSTFDDPGELDTWTGGNKDGNLTIEDGQICNAGSKKTYMNACTSDFGTSDFTADLNGISIEKTGSGNTGYDFMFRSPDEKNGYQFTYNSKTNIFRFWKRVNGRWILLETTNVPSEWGSQPLDVQLKVEGDTFSAYKDGELIIQASDDTFTEGQYGIRNKPGSKTCFDEIDVQQNP